MVARLVKFTSFQSSETHTAQSRELIQSIKDQIQLDFQVFKKFRTGRLAWTHDTKNTTNILFLQIFYFFVSSIPMVQEKIERVHKVPGRYYLNIILK